jgi:hypothetical protein
MALSDGANREILRMSKMAGVRDIILRSSPGKNIQERRTSKSRTQTCLDRMKDFGSELDFEPYEAIDTSRSGAPLELEPPPWRVFPRQARVSETPMLSETMAQLQKINIFHSIVLLPPIHHGHVHIVEIPPKCPISTLSLCQWVTWLMSTVYQTWTVSDVTAWLGSALARLFVAHPKVDEL